jgi:cell division protein FtsQ
MNNGVAFSDTFYSMSNQGKVEKTEKKVNKVNLLKVLFIILGLLILAEILIYTVLMPCLAPVKVTYSGLETFSAQQISNYLEITPKLTWIQFDSAKAATKLAGNAVIENVVIEKRFPDQVFVNIVERKAAAVSLVNINGKTVPIQIDKNGVIFAVDRGMPNASVPLITGFSFESISEGMRLNGKLRPLMEQIAEIQSTNPEYFSVLSEIRVVPKDYGSYELELYPVHSRIKVITDRTLNLETLQYMMVVLDVFNSMQTNVTELYLRYGSIYYK